jgi:hypothetical protein
MLPCCEGSTSSPRIISGQFKEPVSGPVISAHSRVLADASALRERWPIQSYPFKPHLHNRLVAGVASGVLRLRTRKLERLIFTATTGRSGTQTLARIFAAIPECRATHEPHPMMNGAVLQAASHGDSALVDRVYRQIKSINILRQAAGRRYYLEANHLFIKTFARHAINDFGERLAVVHLVRPAVEVATSIYCLQDFPGTERGNYWWLDYQAPSNLLPIKEILDTDPEFSHPFYKALWYWYEIEARIADWHARVPTLRMVRFETQWLNQLPRVLGLLEAVGVEYPRAAIEAVVGLKENRKEHQKLVVALPDPLADQMDSRFRALLGRLRYRSVHPDASAPRSV